MWREETETHIFRESAHHSARTWNQFFLQRPQLCHTYVSYAKQEGNSHLTTYFFPFALCRRIKIYIRPGLQSTWCVHVCGGGGYICVVMGSVCVDVCMCVQLWTHVYMEVRDWHQPSCSLFCWDRFSDWTWSSQMQGSSYLYLCSSGLVRAWSCTWFYIWVLGQVLMLIQAVYQEGPLPSCQTVLTG